MIGSTVDSDSNSDLPDVVGILAEDFLRLHREGQKPTIEEYCDRFPEFAERIHTLFPTILAMEQCGTTKANGSNQFSFDTGNRPKQIGDFQIVREIGRGGMGVVYEAEQQSLRRRVALKVLASGALSSTSTIERFRREARAAARLHHSNIVPVFGVGEEDGLNYYVMQYIDGAGLDEVMVQLGHSKRLADINAGKHDPSQTTCSSNNGNRKEKPSAAIEAAIERGNDYLTGSEDQVFWNRIATIGMKLANAIHFAHLQGVLHRDVKPANILIDSQCQVWLTDFGLAQSSDDDNLTRSGDIFGTLRYLAPERLKGEFERRSDVYSLGITLYELITLVPAFPEANRAMLIQQISQQHPKRPRSLNRRIPRNLETIVLKAIEKEPSQRYESADELANDLSRFVNDLPIQARRNVLAEQLWRWCRRNPGLALLNSAVGFLLLGLAIAWGTVIFLQSDRDLAQSAMRVADQARISANRAEQIATARGHLAKAISFRQSALAGRKSRSLSEIELALQVDVPDEIELELRCEAIATLAQIDVRFAEQLPAWTENAGVTSFDRQLTRYTCFDTSGIITIHQTIDGQETGRIRTQRSDTTHVDLSPLGHFIVENNTQNDGMLVVWDVENCEKVFGLNERCTNYAFDQEENIIAICSGEAAVQFYDLESGKLIRKLSTAGIPNDVAISPDQTRLSIVVNQESVHVVDIESGKILQNIATGQSAMRSQWHPDNNQLAISFVESGNIELWDCSENSKLHELIGHDQLVGTLAFTKNGDYIVSGSWDGAVRIWETGSGNQIAILTGGGLIRGGHENVVALRYHDNLFQKVELDLTKIFMRLTTSNALEKSNYRCGATSPDGRLLVAGTYEGLEFWDVMEQRLLFQSKCPSISQLRFDPSGDSIVFTSKTRGMESWPLQAIEGGWRIEAPISLIQGGLSIENASATPDGQLWAVIGSSGYSLLTKEKAIISDVKVPLNHDTIVLSPDGTNIVTWGWHSPTMCVWKACDGRLLKEFRFRGASTAAFTPNSKEIILSTGTEYTFKSLENFEDVRTIERTDCPYPGVSAYSPGGDLVALELSWGVIHLLRTDNFQTVARLEAPTKNRPSQCQFSADGKLLTVFHIHAGETHVWNIDEIRQRLRKMELDWESDSGRVSVGYGENTLSQHVPASHQPLRLDVAKVVAVNMAAETPQKTLNKYEQEFSARPDSDEAVNNLCWLLLTGPSELRDYQRAFELLERKFDPKSIDALYRNTVAVAYYRMERYDEAVVLFRQNLIDQPDEYLGYDLFFLAMCYWQLGDKTRSRETLAWADRMLRLKRPMDDEVIKEIELLRAEAEAVFVVP